MRNYGSCTYVVAENKSLRNASLPFINSLWALQPANVGQEALIVFRALDL